MQDKEMGGWGEKVKRSPGSDPHEKCALNTKARAELDGHLPLKPRAGVLPRRPELKATPAFFSAALPVFAENLSTKKPPRNKTWSPWKAGRRWDPVT